MNVRASIDVSALPDCGFTTRSPIWWGQFWMLVIESVAIFVLLAAYFYARMGFDVWPPPRIAVPDLTIGTIATVLLLISMGPMYFSDKAVREGHIARGMVLLLVGIAFAVAVLCIRWWELVHYNFKWSTGMFGSYAWCLVGLHTIHLVADTLESAVIFVILWLRPTGGKQQQAVEVDSLYWYFVVLIWIPIFLSIYVYAAVSKT